MLPNYIVHNDKKFMQYIAILKSVKIGNFRMKNLDILPKISIIEVVLKSTQNPKCFEQIENVHL